VISVLRGEGYDIDIFLHTWSETDTSEKSWHNLYGDKRGRAVDDTDIEFIKEAYNPKYFLIEEPLKLVQDFEFIERVQGVPRQFFSVINSLYTRYKVNEMRIKYEKENNIEYEYVIQTRPDIKFEEPFILKNFLQPFHKCSLSLPENTLFYASSYFARGDVESDELVGGTDLINFAKPAAMNKVNNFYEAINSGKIEKEWIIENCFSLEALQFIYWRTLGLYCVKLRYFYGESFVILRNIKEYSKLHDPKSPPIQRHTSGRELFLRLLRKSLKFLPYCCVYRAIDKLNKKIKIR